ncbi:hypothetical protein XENORESO_020280 [Xenotaenia resolanae]|uniref:Uncharacterized protein n=1 Tax=Xenotaenia resolanae TaxID=208358 RepID=A0ABV0WLZ4_9TELE
MMEQKLLQEEVLAGSVNYHLPAEQHAEKDPATPTASYCHVSTQTSPLVTDSDTQTDAQHLSLIAAAKTPPRDKLSRQISFPNADPDATLKDAFNKLSKERQHHYSSIRSKLEHMVTSLTERRELADVTNVTQSLGAHSSRQRIHKDCVLGTNPRLPAESGGMGTWPRARCVN